MNDKPSPRHTYATLHANAKHGKAPQVARPACLFVFVGGDESLPEDQPGNISSLTLHTTAEDFVLDLRYWVQHSMRDCEDTEQAQVAALLENGAIVAAANLVADLTGRWWACLHTRPDEGEEDLMRHDPDFLDVVGKAFVGVQER